MFCPCCGKKMIWNSDFDNDYDFCYEFTSFFSCNDCNILVEKTTYYGDSQPEETIFTIIDMDEEN
jgi:hypothetical protein